MAGVRDEPFLCFQVMHEGRDGLVGKEREDSDIEKDAEEAEPDGIAEEGMEIGKVSRAVHDDDELAAVRIFRLHETVTRLVLLHEAGRRWRLERCLGKGDGLVLREGDDVLHIDGSHPVLRIKMNGEITCLVSKFRSICRGIGTGNREPAGRGGIVLMNP